MMKEDKKNQPKITPTTSKLDDIEDQFDKFDACIGSPLPMTSQLSRNHEPHSDARIHKTRSLNPELLKKSQPEKTTGMTDSEKHKAEIAKCKEDFCSKNLMCPELEPFMSKCQTKKEQKCNCKLYCK
mmetsp:Transcript_14644/g.22705  ORF Transcript_14644/g.22705 Transcript_14644/m.22705 type:complete len:127 (+) Transcript_14644:278-658(+)